MSKKILICDDAVFMRSMLKDILIKEDYEIVGEAENGNEAIKLTGELKPDVVLLDITMPEKSGLDSIKDIKKAHEGAKILMCSAMSQKQIVLESLKAGASDFIIKPFEEDRVVEAVARAVEG